VVTKLRLIKPKIKDSADLFARPNSQMMKIPLFIKPFTLKVCFSFALFVYIVAQPSHAYASFFSGMIAKVLGNEAQAKEEVPVEEKKDIDNSQTMPLLESSINPDIVSIHEALPTTVIEDETLISNVGPLGPSLDLSDYGSSAKISTYIVKSGDTLEGIAKKLGVSKSTILSSNADLKGKDLLKVGQSLTILPIEGIAHIIKKGDTIDAIALKYNAKSADIREYNDLGKTASLKVGESIIVPGGKISEKVEKPVAKKEVAPTPKSVTVAPKPKQESAPLPVVEAPVPPSVEVSVPAVVPENSGQPAGTISGGYIWPFPEGMGRVSQGLHGDQGYDFAAPKGTPILAIQSGTVLIADNSGYNGGYGLYVVVNFDDGGQAIFGHMSKVAAVAGQVVKRGDVIGYVGSTGKSTGNHVHIGYRGGKPSPYKGLKVNSTALPTDHD